jgi:hypothetical protein
VAKVLGTKKTERAGVNAFKTTLEAAGHIVQEIDGGNDYGEDCYLSFTHLGRRTGDLAAVQVKSGVKYRRAIGYAIPCREHIEDWTRSRIPVIGVVYDPEMRTCYWVNLTGHLRRERARGKKPKSVPVSEDSALEGPGIEEMVTEVREYIADRLGENTPPYKGLKGVIQRTIDERQQKRAEHFSSAPLGGHPIPLFESQADFLEKHPNFVPRLLAILTYGLMIATQAAMLPGLYEAASSKYGSLMSISWLVSYYGMIWYLLMIGRKDSHRSRSSALRYSAYALILCGWYVSAKSFTSPPPWPVSKTFEEIFVVAIPQLAKLAIFLIGGHYLALEFGRRRRIAKIRNSTHPAE